jgi:hypothetical protein
MEMTNNNAMSNSGASGKTGVPGEEWIVPQGVHIPEPTYMPVFMAIGMVCLLWGIVTTPLISLVGAALFVISIVGWIGELRHEHGHPGAK